MEQLQATKVIRKIMRKYGRKYIWTNKYYTGTRTVKCWASDVFGEKSAAMVKEISKALRAAKVPFEVRYYWATGYNLSPDSIIIALFGPRNI
jgi:hypothetical protein